MANIKFTEFPSATVVGSMDIIPIVQDGANKKTTASVFSTYIGTLFVNLTGTQTITGSKTFSSQLISNVATGTAPFSIASTTKVTNLNADLLDGLSSADFQLALTNPITGTGTTSYLPKFTGTSALGNSIVSDNGTIAYVSGNLQIENDSPILTIKRNSGDFPTINFATGATIFSSIISNSSSGEQRYSISPSVSWGDYHTFYTDTTERMRITSGGNVLIGTTTDAGYKLDVNGTARVSGQVLVNTGTTNQNTKIFGDKVGISRTSDGAEVVYFSKNTDLGAEGTANINGYDGIQFRTQGAETVKLTIAASGAATFSSTLNAKAGSYINGASNSDWGFSVENTGTTNANGLYVNIGSSSTGIPFRVDKGGSSLFNIANSGAATFSADATINGVKVGKGAGSIADNTAVGKLALNSNTSGADNTSFGSQTLYSNTTGSSNIGLGTYPLYSNTTGNNNVAVGHATLYINSTGSNNVAVGNNALFLNTASNNTAVGFEAGYSNTSGTGITAIGDRALKASTGNYNTAVGTVSLFSNTTGNSNTSIGYFALVSNTTGSNNTAIGLQSLGYNTTGSNNVAIGRDTLYSNTASNNTAVGYEAAYSNTSGLYITAIGYRALRNSTGNSNTAIGNEALTANTTGTSNTAIGYFALAANTTGVNNIAIGENTQSGNFSGSVIIGNDAIATGNNQFVIGSAAVNAGTVATETNTSSKVWNVVINGVAQKILLA